MMKVTVTRAGVTCFEHPSVKKQRQGSRNTFGLFRFTDHTKPRHSPLSLVTWSAGNWDTVHRCVGVRVKLSLRLTKHHARTEDVRESGGIASRILNLGTSIRWVVSFTKCVFETANFRSVIGSRMTWAAGWKTSRGKPVGRPKHRWIIIITIIIINGS
jgi:hypothetical protein